MDGEEVEQLYVDPDHAGRGLARCLYETIEDVARARDARQLTAVASLRAIPVFKRLGFAEVQREGRRFDGRAFQVADMVKRLT